MSSVDNNAVADILFRLIQADMNQIQAYGETILNYSLVSIGASFAVSAYIFTREDASSIDLKTRRLVSLFISAGLVLTLVVVGIFYWSALDASRLVLMCREASLVDLFVGGHVFSVKAAFYPDILPSAMDQSLWLQKMPIVLAPLAIVLKSLLEFYVISRRIARKLDV